MLHSLLTETNLFERIVLIWLGFSNILTGILYCIFVINHGKLLSVKDLIRRVSRMPSPEITYIISPISSIVYFWMLLKKIKTVFVNYYKRNYTL